MDRRNIFIILFASCTFKNYIAAKKDQVKTLILKRYTDSSALQGYGMKNLSTEIQEYTSELHPPPQEILPTGGTTTILHSSSEVDNNGDDEMLNEKRKSSPNTMTDFIHEQNASSNEINAPRAFSQLQMLRDLTEDFSQYKYTEDNLLWCLKLCDMQILQVIG